MLTILARRAALRHPPRWPPPHPCGHNGHVTSRPEPTEDDKARIAARYPGRSAVDVVIFTALATLGSFLYNLAATMLGGLEITLAED